MFYFFIHSVATPVVILWTLGSYDRIFLVDPHPKLVHRKSNFLLCETTFDDYRVLSQPKVLCCFPTVVQWSFTNYSSICEAGRIADAPHHCQSESICDLIPLPFSFKMLNPQALSRYWLIWLKPTELCQILEKFYLLLWYDDFCAQFLQHMFRTKKFYLNFVTTPNPL